MSTCTVRIQADMQRAMLVHEHNKKKALEPRVTEPIILPEKPEKKIEPTPQRVTSPAPEPKAESQAEGQAEQQTPQTATQLNSTAAAIASYGFTYDMSALYAAYGLGMPTVNAMSAVNMMPGYSFPATADVTTAMAQSQGAVAATGVADTVASEAPTSSKAAVAGPNQSRKGRLWLFHSWFRNPKSQDGIGLCLVLRAFSSSVMILGSGSVEPQLGP